MTPDNLGAGAKQEFGQSVPDFSLPLLNGSGERTLESYLDGKQGGVIVFWSAICTHCVRYDPYFNSFAESHPDMGLVAIASRSGETRQQIQAAIAERGLRFPILWDRTGDVARRYRAQQTPRCYLAGPDGALLYRGAIDNFKIAADNEYVAYLEPAISQFRAGQAIARPETASFGCAIETVYYKLPKQL